MESLEITINELEQLRAKQPSYRARVYLEWAIENLKKFHAIEVNEGFVNRSKKQ